MVRQPSSLVFVAILLGWAVYLLPQWVHRREALSQSRGRDRYSSGLRVLDRRRRVSGGPSSTPLLPDPRAAGRSVMDPLAESPAAPRPASPGQPGTVRQAPPRAGGSSVLAARRRARVLSVLLVLTATSWVAAFAVPLPGVVAWAWTALLGLDLVALVIAGRRRAVRRASAARERRHRAAQVRRRSERPARPGPAVTAAASEAGVTGTASEAGVTGTASEAGVTGTASEAGVTGVTSAAGAAATGPLAAPAADTRGPASAHRPERASQRVARELSEGTPSASWTPVPVPPPTYTRKPAVPRPEPAPLGPPLTPPPAEPPVAPEAPRAPRPWDENRSFADDLDLDVVLARRRAVNS